MTKRWRTIFWVAGCGLGLMIIAGLALRGQRNRTQLPAVAHYGKLPVQFDQALQTARDRVFSHENAPDEARKLARLYQANRLYPEARACYQVIAATAAGLTAQDHYYLADIAQNDGDVVEAQKELRAVLASAPGYLPARIALADSFFKSGQEEEAGKEYAAILKSEANQPEAALGLARLELQRGQDAAALARLEALLAAHPAATAGAAVLAQILDRRGEAERAAIVTTWSQQTPEPPAPDPWLNSLLPDCYEIQTLTFKFEEYLTNGRMEQALPLLARIEQLDPQSWMPQLIRGWSEAGAQHHREALEAYRRALARGGKPEGITPLLAASLLALGEVDEAAAVLAGAYAKKPDSFPLLMAYASVVVRQGDNKTARILLPKLLAKEPNMYTPNMNWVKLLWAAGERDAALPYLQRVVSLYPDDVGSRGLLAQYYLEKADPIPAIAPLEQAVPHAAAGSQERRDLTGMLLMAYLQAGRAEAGKGNWPATGQYAERAIGLDPASLLAYEEEAIACSELKQFRRAAEAFQKMAALQPDNPAILLRLGDMCYQDGAVDQARQHWQHALQLTAAGGGELRDALDLRLNGQVSPETFK